MKHVNVVAAVIEFNGKILCVQRNYNKYDYISFKYEFPGGKVEDHESHEEAIVREIQEELSLDIKVKNHLITVEHTYPDFKITMDTFHCSCNSNQITLHEHVDSKWLNIDELSSLDWAGADIPIVQKLMNK